MSGIIKYSDYEDDGLTSDTRFQILSTLLTKGGVITTNIGFASTCFTKDMATKYPQFEIRMGPTVDFAKPYMDSGHSIADIGTRNLAPWEKPVFSGLKEVDPAPVRIAILFDELYHRPLKDVAAFHSQSNREKYEPIRKVSRALGMDISNHDLHSLLQTACRIMTDRDGKTASMFVDLQRRGETEPEVRKTLNAFMVLRLYEEEEAYKALAKLYEYAFGADYIMTVPIAEGYALMEEEMSSGYGVTLPGEGEKEGDRMFTALNANSLFIRKREKQREDM